MKKMLLAASAAAVVGGLAFVGSSPAQAQEVEGFQLQIGGFYNALAIVRDQDSVPRVNNDGDVVGKDKIRRYDFNQRGRFTIQGAQTLDNGMTVGFHTQYEMQNNMNNNRSYVFADGGFGRVQFGTMYSAPYLMHVSPPTAGWGIDDTGHDEATASINGLGFPASMPYYINRSMNFTYMTPRFGGFQAGFTFAPDQRNNQGRDNRIATNLSSQNRNMRNGDLRGPTQYSIDEDLQNIVGVAVNYEQSFDAWSIGASAGFETGEWNQGAKNAIDADGLNDKRAWSASGGLTVGFGGLNVGGAYNWNNMGLSGIRQHTVTAGLTYTVDRFTFGPSFGMTWEKGSNSADREIQVYDFGARYAFAPGVNLVGSIQHVRYDNGDLSSDHDGKGTAGLFGVQLNF